MLAIIGVVVVGLALCALAVAAEKRPTIAQGSSKDGATAAALGGQIGWPVTEWADQHKGDLGPETDNGTHSNPIHGIVAGYHYVTYRTSWTLNPVNQPGAIYTFYANAAAVRGISETVPDLEIISTRGGWHLTFNWQPLDDRRFTCGDTDFDGRWAVHSTAPAQAAAVLTAQVKEVLMILEQTVGAPRIRVRNGVLYAWFQVKDDIRVQHESYLRYLQALTLLARAMTAAVPGPQSYRNT